YDLGADAAEARNLLKREAARAAKMRAALPAAGVASAGAVDRETVQKLRSLGYLASGQPTRGTAADPKAKIAVYERIAAAQELLAVGQVDRASALLSEALRAEPEIALAHHQLGTCYLRQERNREAAAEFWRATELNPRMSAAWFDLGLAQAALRDFG